MTTENAPEVEANSELESSKPETGEPETGEVEQAAEVAQDWDATAGDGLDDEAGETEAEAAEAEPIFADAKTALQQIHDAHPAFYRELVAEMKRREGLTEQPEEAEPTDPSTGLFNMAPYMRPR